MQHSSRHYIALESILQDGEMTFYSHSMSSEMKLLEKDIRSFLLTFFSSNYGPIFHHFQDTGQNREFFHSPTCVLGPVQDVSFRVL